MATSREEIIRLIKELDEQGYPLYCRVFEEKTGIRRDEWMKQCEVDNWDQLLAACRKRSPRYKYDARLTKEELGRRIRSAYEKEGKDYLGFERFLKLSGTGRRDFFRHYPEKQKAWSTACKEWGIRDALKATQQKNMMEPVYTRKQCVDELRRVAKLLGRKRGDTMTQEEYKRYGTISLNALKKRFDNKWEKALESVGLVVTSQYHRKIPLQELAKKFLKVTKELKKIPSQAVLARRSGYDKNTFARTGKRTYPQFKKEAIEYLFSSRNKIASAVRHLFEAELDKLRAVGASKENRRHKKNSGKRGLKTKADVAASFEHGKTLNFRGIAFAPTYEQEVVAVFSACATDLGFEIRGMRPAFPDCKARRRKEGDRGRYEECLIEFEFRSTDFRKHRHDNSLCDLIVCWEDDWGEKAPIEVLELKSAIKQLL
ncbi:MAG TPA: hypothetical protein VJL29_02785 [Thermoguttaceae bacterium]|nr:hypothetical protein [Thermoguttaceae bacterium]